MTRARPPADRGSTVHRLVELLASGPKSRAELRAAGFSAVTLRKALQRMRDRGWVFDGVALNDAGKKAAQELAGWAYEDSSKAPVDHLVEQVRQYKGVRWG